MLYNCRLYEVDERKLYARQIGTKNNSCRPQIVNGNDCKHVTHRKHIRNESLFRSKIVRLCFFQPPFFFLFI